MKKKDPFTLASSTRVLLGFADPWQDTNTKPFKYVPWVSQIGLQYTNFVSLAQA